MVHIGKSQHAAMEDEMATAQELINNVWSKVQEMEHRRVMEDIAEGRTEEHKLYPSFPKGKQYRYYDGGTVDGVKQRFCYSVHKNAAGYFMTWQECWSSTRAWRIKWRAHKMKKRAISLARGLADESRRKHAN